MTTDKITSAAPCPYCGETGTLKTATWYSDHVDDGTAVECLSCGFMLCGATEAAVLNLLVCLMERQMSIAEMIRGGLWGASEHDGPA